MKNRNHKPRADRHKISVKNEGAMDVPSRTGRDGSLASRFYPYLIPNGIFMYVFPNEICKARADRHRISVKNEDVRDVSSLTGRDISSVRAFYPYPTPNGIFMNFIPNVICKTRAGRHRMSIKKDDRMYVPSHTGRNVFTFDFFYLYPIPNGIFSENFKELAI